ncbi:hypothetical protein JVU11DRAFT_10538 [Chiua virens]|nr:hypothetical protein JVU11DRAFT_10538 [Chiua virens]
MSFRPVPNHVYPNETLILSGYLGCVPLFPTIAISLRTLAAFHQLHCSCPRFSIQAAAKTLCFLHHIPYRPYLTVQLSNTSDVYLEILHRMDCQLKRELK